MVVNFLNRRGFSVASSLQSISSNSVVETDKEMRDLLPTNGNNKLETTISTQL